ncbi:transposase [Streptomyces sp. NPDC001698]|nr:transposase [Streptomyces sp. CoT10]
MPPFNRPLTIGRPPACLPPGAPCTTASAPGPTAAAGRGPLHEPQASPRQPRSTDGRRRHVVVDTLGLILMVTVTPADTTERVTAAVMLTGLRQRFRTIRTVWADSGYTGDLVTWLNGRGSTCARMCLRCCKPEVAVLARALRGLRATATVVGVGPV